MKVTVLLVLGLTLSNCFTTYVNDLEEDFNFECPSGYGLVRVESTQGTSMDGNVDRQWDLECTKVN